MRIFMQTKTQGPEAPRYYHLILQQDLLGGWSLTREWGHPGGRASAKREVYLERDAAERALMSARDAQIKRGFQVMFCQGSEAPEGARYG
jgi:predicted DNA-binding WGR domain protein